MGINPINTIKESYPTSSATKLVVSETVNAKNSRLASTGEKGLTRPIAQRISESNILSWTAFTVAEREVFRLPAHSSQRNDVSSNESSPEK